MGPISIGVLAFVAAVFGYLWWHDYQSRKPAPRTWRYCPWCRGKLQMGEVDGKERMHCKRKGCSFVHWDNPLPVAVVLIPNKDGHVFLVQRGVAPRAGMWALPGGFIDRGETPDQGAVREAKEETGLDVEIERLLWWTVTQNNNILFFFLAKPNDGTPKPGSDALAVKPFAQGTVPVEIAFPTHRQTIEDWFASK